MNKKVVTLFCVILLIMGRVYISYALGNDEIIKNEKIITTNTDWIIDGEIVYPLTPSDEEWKKLFTETERVEACQIPDEIIDKLSSEELMNAVVEYPLMGTLYIYSDMQTGFNILIKNCNALRELLLRDDCIETVVKYYKTINIPENTIVDWPELVNEKYPEVAANEIIDNPELLKYAHEDAKIIYACDLSEMILAVKNQEMDSEEVDELIGIALEKKIQKNKSEIFNGIKDSTYLDMACTTIKTSNIIQYDEDGNPYKETELRSPSGYTFTVDEYLTSSNCNYQFWAELVAQTPYAIIVSIAAVTFNCHSYAWLSDIYPNKYIYYTLNSVPSALYNDPVFKKETSPNHNGEIVYWKSGLHSGKLNGTQIYQIEGHMSPKILSKWGGGPMVLHYLNAYDGFGCGVEYYYKYK